MKFISWNVNGIRACVQKGFTGFLSGNGRRYFLHSGDEAAGRTDMILTLPGYHPVLELCRRRKVIPGLPFLPKRNHCRWLTDIGIEEHDHEGRVITLEFENFLYGDRVYTKLSE